MSVSPLYLKKGSKSSWSELPGCTARPHINHGRCLPPSWAKATLPFPLAHCFQQRLPSTNAGDREGETTTGELRAQPGKTHSSPNEQLRSAPHSKHRLLSEEHSRHPDTLAVTALTSRTTTLTLLGVGSGQAQAAIRILLHIS